MEMIKLQDHEISTQRGDGRNRILEVIIRSPDTALDDIVLACPDLTWNQVFLVLDRLRREGVLTVNAHEHGQYTIHVLTTPIQEWAAAASPR
jgi:hypothetical protein